MSRSAKESSSSTRGGVISVEETVAKPRFVIEPVESSRRNNYTTNVTTSRFTPQLLERSRRNNMAVTSSRADVESSKPRFSPIPVETSKRSNRTANAAPTENPATPTPTPLTKQALNSFLSSLPQPISTTRYSNREDSQIFSDRDSAGCPSLSSSPVSTTSTASYNTVSHSAARSDGLQSREHFTQFQRHGLSNNILDIADDRPKATSSPIKETSFQHQPLTIRSNTREFPSRDQSFDNAIQSHALDQQRQQLQRLQEQQSKVLQLQQKQFKLTKRTRPHAQQKPIENYKPVPVSDASKTPKKKKLLVPFSFIGSRNPVMMLDVKNQVLNSPLPTTRYYESSKKVDGDYFSSRAAEPSTPSSTISRSTSATSSNDTNITIPTIEEEDPTSCDDKKEVFTEPESDVDPNLCPSSRAEVTTEFVQMVFTYASLNHEAIGRKFDEELALGNKWSIERVKADRFEALREYVCSYVDVKPHVVAGQGCW